jgi:hypothetical protein
MTVCIAAACNEGKAMVVAADRMFTNPGLSVEFETEEKKIEPLGRKCVAMASGNSVHATEILELTRLRLANQTPPIFQVATYLKEEYGKVRNRKAFETVVLPMVGMDFEQYQKANMPLPTYMDKQNQMYQNIAINSMNFNLGTDFLVAGIDQIGAQLAHVAHPGVLSPLGKLGYAAIGSGANHAMLRLSLDKQSRHRGIYETLASVYIAKRMAEVAPGVGDATDIAIIDDQPEVWHCPPLVLEELEKIRQAVSAPTALPDLTALKELCDVKPKKH